MKKVIDLSSPCVYYITFDYKISLFAECFPSSQKKKKRKGRKSSQRPIHFFQLVLVLLVRDGMIN